MARDGGILPRSPRSELLQEACLFHSQVTRVHPGKPRNGLNKEQKQLRWTRCRVPGEDRPSLAGPAQGRAPCVLQTAIQSES